MRKIIAITIIFLACFCFNSFSQSVTVEIFDKIMRVDNVRITDRKLSYTSPKNNREIIVGKTDVSRIEFQNGIKFKYTMTQAHSIESTSYNATVNLIDGSFFTAFIDSLNSGYVYYHKLPESNIQQLDINKILFITYVNGLQESIISPASVEARKRAAETPAEKPVENIRNHASYIGATAGLSNAWLEEDGYLLNRKGRNGLLLGMNYEYQFSKKSGINTGLRYEQKGSKYFNDSIETKFNFPYLTLPASYRVYLGENNFKVYFDMGFYFGFLLAAHYVVENSNSQTTETINLNSSDFDIKHVDFGPTGGIGFNYKKSLYLFSLGMQYSPGLVTVQSGDYNYYPYYYSFSTLNRNVVFYATFGFDLLGWKKQQRKIKSIQ